MVFLANLNKYWLVFATAVSSVLLLSVRSRLCCALFVDPQVFCGSLLLVLQILFFGVTFCIALLVAFQENREN